MTKEGIHFKRMPSLCSHTDARGHSEGGGDGG